VSISVHHPGAFASGGDLGVGTPPQQLQHPFIIHFKILKTIGGKRFQYF